MPSKIIIELSKRDASRILSKRDCDITFEDIARLNNALRIDNGITDIQFNNVRISTVTTEVTIAGVYPNYSEIRDQLAEDMRKLTPNQVEIAMTHIGTEHLLTRRIQTVRKLAPGCGLLAAKRWVEVNMPDEQ